MLINEGLKELVKTNVRSFIQRNHAPVAQLVEHRAIMREVEGLNLGRINSQDLEIPEKKVMPL